MGDEGQIRPDLEAQVWNRRDSCCCSAQKKERKPRGEIKKKKKRDDDDDESDFARGAKRRKAMMMMMLCSLDIPGNLTSKFFLNLMKKFVLFASNCTNFPTASFTSDTPSDTASYAAAAASFMASFLLFSFVFLVLLLRDFSFSIWNLLNVVRVSSSSSSHGILINAVGVDGGCCFPFFFVNERERERERRDIF